jgi:TusA-related sulfurtransferase
VIATHPDSVREFRVLCRDPGLELLSFREMDGTFGYVIKKLY